MIKRFFIIILLIASSYTVYSQSLGVEAGVRINTARIEYPGVNITRKSGFEGGVFYKYPISVLPLNIRAAVLYSNSAFSLKNDLGNSIGITYHFEENKLKLPLTVEYKPFSGLIDPFFFAGLYTTYSLSGSIKDSDSSSSLKYRQNSHKFDYGSIVGVGASLTSHLALRAAYEYGFVRRDIILGDQIVSVRERGVSIQLNYLF